MDLDIYTTEMSKSVWDKAFFMDKIPGVKCVIDFGCADGAMIRMLAKLFPKTTFYGYDFNDILIDEAWHKLEVEEKNRVFFYRANNTKYKNVPTFDDMIKTAKKHYRSEEICINFSSVLHEIFSSSPSGKATIKMLIEELKPKYVTVRDMYYHCGDYKGTSYVQGPIFIDDFDPYKRAFEAVYGSIKNNPKNLLHFLMKYQWKNNGWEIELNENYFSWEVPDLWKLIGHNYNIVFENHYQLPYLTEVWSKMFFHPQYHTHAQFILRRDDY